VRRNLAALAAFATLLGLSGLAAAAPVTAAAVPSPATSTQPMPTTPDTTAEKKPVHPVRNSCAAVTRKGQARCFALVRSDIKPLVSPAGPAVTPNGYGPADLQGAYKLPSAAAGAGQTVAIVDAFDDPTAEADLATYRAQYGLPPCTTANGCFSKVNQNGAAAPLPTPDVGWAQEISLDLDMVSAACPQCHILLVEGNDNSFDNLAASVNTAASLGAKYISNSYGSNGEDPSETAYDSFYNHPGVVVTASTGDGGYGTSYPATAPGVTAVGGTSLTQDTSPRGWSEAAWAGAGSGCSTVEPKPSFQTDAGCPRRSIADVSSVADPQTGVAVYDSYQFQGWSVFGGTSASSPLIASVYALGGTPAAGSNPESYPYANPGSLYDVTTGDNGTCTPAYLCTAGAGFDGPTGLGTPNGTAAFRSGPHGTVKGLVTDSATSKPIVGAKITADTASALTGTDGSYTLSVPVGTYDITASAYGYASITQSGVAIADGQTLTESFALVAVPRVVVSGNVTDGSGHGWPLYAKITAAGTPGAPVYTDPLTGHYQLNLPSGTTYSLTVSPVYPGYTAPVVSVPVASADVVKNVAVPVDASCTAAGYTTHYAGVVEHFDGTTIPPTWTVKDNNASGGVWVANDPGHRGNLTGGSGNFAIIDSDALGSGHTQDTTLTSPVVNLANDPSPVVGLNSVYKQYSNSIADIDYTVDGGTTWTNVWHQTTVGQQGPLERPLPGAANQAAVQVRFHYKGTWAYYWEVDDVFIGHKSCDPLPGGIVAGYTKDANTNKPITGVAVKSVDVPADSGISAATPDDSAHPDGFYWLFSSVTGNHKFTASKSKYQSSTKTVAVGSNYVTRKDFALAAGRISVAPAGLSGTATLGGSANTSLTLSNTGTVPVHVKLGEADGGFQIAGRPAADVYATTKGAPVRNVSGHYTPLREHAGAGAAPKATPEPAAAPWQAIANYPSAISNNAASYNDGKVYSVGGYNGTDDVASAYSYDPGAAAWTKLADMSATREAPSSAWINGKLYVTGGWGATAVPTGVTEVYDPAANSWSTGSPNPKPHAGAAGAVLGGKLYVIGGCGTSTCGSTDVEVYDPSSDSWSSGVDYPGAIAWESCGAVDTLIYCAGGTTATGTSKKSYSFDGSTWTPLADMPADAWGSAYSVANGKLVVSGGVINSSASVTNQGWSFDPATGAWTSLPNSNNSFYRLGGACGFYKVGGSVSNASPAHAESEVLPGYDTCASGSADVPWLSESPTEADIPPGASVTVAVTMDSAGLGQPGVYGATLSVGTDTPYQNAPVPVTFTVTPPATFGKISGVVSGRACSGMSAPLAGATVEIDTWAANYTLITDKDGKYVLWLDRRSNPLTLIVAKDGWAPQTRTAKISPAAPLAVNFTLKPAKAC
jgi:N-acetylneuraminic acid mutarotase